MAYPDVVMTELPVPLSIGHVPVVDVAGTPHVVLAPVLQALGLHVQGQTQRLRRQPWAARTCMTHVVRAADGQPRPALVTTVQTFLMLMATVDTARVSADVRERVIAYQCETADAIAAYWTRGVAVNPRGPVVEVMDELHRAHVARQVAQGRRDGDRAQAREAAWRHLDRAYRLALDAGLGVHNALPPTDR